MLSFHEQINILLTSPPRFWRRRMLTFEAYCKALHLVLQTEPRDEAREAALADEIARRYFPWRSMAEAMAADIGRGRRLSSGLNRDGVLAHYQRVVRRQHPELFYAPVERIYRAAGLSYIPPTSNSQISLHSFTDEA